MLSLLLLVIITRSIIWLNKIEELNYTTLYTFTRIDGICIGSMIALLMKFKPKFIENNFTIIVLGLAVLNFMFYFLNQQNKQGYPYFAFIGYTTFCAMFGLLLHEIVTTKNSSFVNRVFSLRPLRFFGKISYGFYIFHWPVYLMTYILFYNFLEKTVNTSENYLRIGASLLSTVLALVISIISYFSFERYFLKLKLKLQ
jgi:peptidoglycan/LPS O-acetylase OafA/YrhL